MQILDSSLHLPEEGVALLWPGSALINCLLAGVLT